MYDDIKPGDIFIPDPKEGECSFPGPVIINAIYDSLPMSETTDKFNTLRNYKVLHETTGGGKGIKIGVGDTGVDRVHLNGDLKGCIAKDFTNSRNGFYDVHSHGTHTTGHIGARGDGQGFIGLAPNAGLYHAKVLGDSGSGSTRGIANGIRWMAEEGCKIINLSLGGGYSADIEAACRDALSAGVLVFASMGNSGMRGGGHPGTSRYTFGITALDYNKRVASFSSRDDAAKYAGYGVQVLSLVTNGRLGRMSGTSMSCPDQCGVAGNILSYMLKLGLPLPKTMEEYEAIVRVGIEDLGTPGKDREYGLGFIDIWKVINHLKEQAPNPEPPIDPPPEEPEEPTDPTPGPAKDMRMGLVSTDDGVYFVSNFGHEAEFKINGVTYKGRASKLGTS